MDRAKAVAFLKELLVSVDMLQTRSFAILGPDAFDIPSQGYKICLKGVLDNYATTCIKELAQKHNLMLTEKRDHLIIYSPIGEKNEFSFSCFISNLTVSIKNKTSDRIF